MEFRKPRGEMLRGFLVYRATLSRRAMLNMTKRKIMNRILIFVSLFAVANVARAQLLDPNANGVRRGKSTTTVQPAVQQPVVAPRVHTNPQINNVSRAPFRNSNVRVQGNVQNNPQFHARHLDLQRARAENQQKITFRQNSAIIEAQRWQGPKYAAFRNYRAQWHDRGWWERNRTRFVFVYGAPYYWDAGWWYPAWGYDPGASYFYDGPIYAYNDLPPEQVTANLQAALQEQGYYDGEIDGVLGPLTRAAIAAYQADHGLYVTAAIDEPTLESLGMI